MSVPTPNRYGLTFHHLGLAVAAPENAVSFLTGLGYGIGATVFDPLQNVHLAMCDHPQMPSVEIIYPAEDAGPLDRILQQHKDGLVYHMCYETRNFEASLDALESDESLLVHCVSSPKEAILFGGRKVSFYLIGGVGLIEIIDSP